MSSNSQYIPPKVWTWGDKEGGQWAQINRPIAGPTHEAELPRGKRPSFQDLIDPVRRFGIH